MKAAIRRKYCGPEGLKIESLPTPKPKSDEVLIKIHTTTVNRTDCGVLTGLPYVFRLFIGVAGPKRIITGTDLAGEVIEVGDAITKFKKGDKVWAFRDEGICSHAEYICLKEKDNVEIMPSTMLYKEAVACLEGAHYAINFINKVELKKGQTVLVNGAAGAIGTQLVQLLRYHGLKITAVCAAKDNELIRSLGAENTIDYTSENVFDCSDQFDFVFDTIGNHSFKKWKQLLQNNGRFISTELGPSNIFPILAISTKFFSSKKVIFPMPTNIKRSMEIMKKIIESGNFKAVIDRTYTLNEITEAFTYVIKGFKTGNVIIQIPEKLK